MFTTGLADFYHFMFTTGLADFYHFSQTNSIVQGIETLADKIPLPNTTGTPVVRVSSGVAIQALKIDKSSKTPLNFGMRNASFSLNNVVSNQDYDSKQVQVGLSLPDSLAR